MVFFFHSFIASISELNHLFTPKGSRNVCVNDFAELLGLKEGVNAKSGVEVRPLKFGTVKHNPTSCFGYGDEPDCWSNIDSQSFSHAPRLQKLIEELKWRESLPGGQNDNVNAEWFAKIKTEMEVKSREAGLVKGTGEWKLRWFFNCATDLKRDKMTKECFVKPEIKQNASFFVCDITEGILMHADTLSDYWMFASPPKGTGTRQYASFVGFQPCTNVGGCPGCMLNATDSVNSCTVKLNPENCSIEVLTH